MVNGIRKLEDRITDKLSILVYLFIVMQPVLDVISYFLALRENNTISTMLRFFILTVTAALGFLLSKRKKVYFLIYGTMILFWILHAANCFRIGYTSFVADTANYLRIISLQIYTLSFITFFSCGKKLRNSICLGYFTNLLLIILFTALPWLTGHPIYTYADPVSEGVMGWFSVKSAQSAIIAILVPIAIYYAYKTGKYWLYLIASLLAVGLMFLTGTKLTYYAIILVCAAFMFLFIINLKRKSMKYVIPLFVLLSVAVLLKPVSPMQRRENQSAHAESNYSNMIAQSVAASGVDHSMMQGADSILTQDDSYRLMLKRRRIFGIYTDPEVYGPVYKDLNERFGVYSVMKAYNYSEDPAKLSDSRARKLIFANMIWEEKDFMTRIFGFEYSDMVHGDEIYDLENDFPAVFFFCGYLGFAMYMLYFVYFVLIVVRALIKKKKDFLSIEMGVVGFTFLLATAAAQISANVLRRPNVTAYFAIAAAFLYHLTVNHLNDPNHTEADGRMQGMQDAKWKRSGETAQGKT